jgi:hypothetical protein
MIDLVNYRGAVKKTSMGLLQAQNGSRRECSEQLREISYTFENNSTISPSNDFSNLFLAGIRLGIKCRLKAIQFGESLVPPQSNLAEDVFIK